MVDSKKSWKAWLYLSPVIILTLIFTVWPIINTIRIAFLEEYTVLGELGKKTFNVGVQNFVKVVEYGGFLTWLKNTLLLTVMTVPIAQMLALIISVGLN